MSRCTDTIAALATPVGTAALAVVRASGPDTAELARVLGGGAAPFPRRVRHGDYRDRTGGLVDDVLFVWLQAPHSYTGEDSLEISCHGNPFIAQKILEDLLARGCRSAGPGEFTQRAFLNGRMELSQAEAVMDLIHARSERALAAANRQMRGALGRRMQVLIDDLLLTVATIEAYIDFPDEDLPGEDQALVLASLDRISAEAGRLLATSHYGEILREGVRTVIVGAPNSGKSSLLNRLVGRERALVSAEPGTTRDFLEEKILVGAHCVRLIDTAGLNPAPGAIERLGMGKTFERCEDADLFLVVIDASSVSPFLPDQIRARLRADNTLVILNKVDLPHGDSDVDLPADLRLVRVSALTGTGFETLVGEISRLADGFQTDVGEDAVAINARHGQALSAAQAGLADARAKLVQGAAAELLASDLRGVLAAFEEIGGRIDTERMLDHLFANFCIGK